MNKCTRKNEILGSILSMVILVKIVHATHFSCKNILESIIGIEEMIEMFIHSS